MAVARSSSGRVTRSQGEGAILGVVRAIQKWRSSLQSSLPRSLQKGLFSRQQRHAAEGIIQYVSQAQIGIRKILSAGDAAYRPERGDGSAQRGRSLISTIALFPLAVGETQSELLMSFHC